MDTTTYRLKFEVISRDYPWYILIDNQIAKLEADCFNKDMSLLTSVMKDMLTAYSGDTDLSKYTLLTPSIVVIDGHVTWPVSFGVSSPNEHGVWHDFVEGL